MESKIKTEGTWEGKVLVLADGCADEVMYTDGGMNLQHTVRAEKSTSILIEIKNVQMPNSNETRTVNILVTTKCAPQRKLVVVDA